MNRQGATLFNPIAVLGTTLLLSSVSHAVQAATFIGEPLFSEVRQYSTEIELDPTDIYYPVVSDPTVSTPIVLLLQGALVDKADYSIYASIVASYGFTVVAPNNLRTIPGPGGVPFTGLLPEQRQVPAVLEFMALENTDPTSPVTGLLDTNSLGLLGHSFGGAVGIASVQDNCFPGLCTDSYSFPEELKAGIFYGAGFDLSDVGFPGVPPIDNQAPIGLILGTRDGVIRPDSPVTTYNNILNQPKLFVELEGANHYGITNENNPIRAVNDPTLEQDIATETIARWSAAFLQAYILDDPAALEYVNVSGDAQDPNVTVTNVAKIPESSYGAGLFVVPLLLFRRRILSYLKSI
ncbi:MAG: chlorophyllase [Oscillatoriales cyanobacterium RM1_1_9]|nr:chlorophyllase [Oscillatoriales cyanobacterium SM2_3_0]NJO45789.1 chlorophyllase [Oscillatoriales cyanobacterium RM2_1_1]NJO70544.1 chlorophyllase [Oscillatoriales cyanobacterium RM1_1_9]